MSIGGVFWATLLSLSHGSKPDIESADLQVTPPQEFVREFRSDATRIPTVGATLTTQQNFVTETEDMHAPQGCVEMPGDTWRVTPERSSSSSRVRENFCQ